MMDIKKASVQMAIQGLEEGYRVIAFLLNSEFAKRGLEIRIDCEDKRPTDSLFKAREQMRRALPKLDTLNFPSDLSTVSPWTIGRLGDPGTPPWPVYLSDEPDMDTQLFISDCFDFPEQGDTKFWNECIVDTVSAYHEEWKQFLSCFGPSSEIKAKIEEALRRKHKLSELYARLSFSVWKSIDDSDTKNLGRLEKILRPFGIEFDKPHGLKKVRLKKILDKPVQ